MQGLDLRKLAEPDPVKGEEKPLVSRDHVVNVRYTAPNGKVFEGPVTSRILDGDERLRVATRCGQLAQGPWDRLPLTDAARITALVTVAVQLRTRPEWMDEWLTVDDALLFSLYSVCVEHTERYFRGNGRQGEGDAVVSRVELRPADPAR